MADPDRPAIAGGTPAKTTPFGNEDRYGDDELRELRDALAQGSLFSMHGAKTPQLEHRFAEMLGARFAVAVSSGTAAIHAALMALGISPGDEVITSPITDMGSVVSILWQQAVPVFADLDPHSYCLDPESVEAAITPKTRAVLAVHLWGNACDLDALREICLPRGIEIVEDCAQAHGCTYRGRHAGTIGRIGCFSLNEFKHIACGDGGVAVTDDEGMNTRLRLACDKGYNRRDPMALRSPTFLANNYRITELQSAVALAQLGKLESIVRRRRAWCESLAQKLQGTPGISLPRPTPGCEPSWWFYMVRAEPRTLNADADRLTETLRAEGLPVAAHYIGQCLYEYPIFTNHSTYARGTHPFAVRDYHKGLCTTAEAILETCVMLNVKESYTEADLQETVFAIRRASAWLARRT